MNLTFRDIDQIMRFRFNGKIFYLRGSVKFETNKYEAISRPNIIKFQITDVKVNDTGAYEIDYYDIKPIHLSITSKFMITC